MIDLFPCTIAVHILSVALAAFLVLAALGLFFRRAISGRLCVFLMFLGVLLGVLIELQCRQFIPAPEETPPPAVQPIPKVIEEKKEQKTRRPEQPSTQIPSIPEPPPMNLKGQSDNQKHKIDQFLEDK